MNTAIFDFDGTLADTFVILVAVFNQLAPEFGFDPLTDSDIDRLRDYSARDFVVGLHISPLQLPFLISRAKHMVSQEVSSAQTFPGILSLLKKLKNSGLNLGILTSNSVSNVKTFLNRHSLNQFDFIESENNIFGKDKSLLKILKKYNLNKSDVIYIGDELRDLEACKKVGIKMIAVAWGFNSQSALLANHPDFVVQTPEEIPGLINKS